MILRHNIAIYKTSMGEQHTRVSKAKAHMSNNVFKGIDKPSQLTRALNRYSFYFNSWFLHFVTDFATPPPWASINELGIKKSKLAGVVKQVSNGFDVVVGALAEQSS